MQRFPGRLWGVGNVGGEPQAIPAPWRGWYLVVGVVNCRPSDIAVVVPLHCPPDVPMIEDVYFRGGRGASIASQPTSRMQRLTGGLSKALACGGLGGCPRR